MAIILNNKDGVLLKTAGKYCPEDIIVKPNLQTKTVTANGDISPDDGYCGLGKVTVSVPAPTLQTKTVTPTKSQQTVTPDSNYNGLSQVIVNAIPNEYIIPNGSQNITENGTYDITSKASVVVNVPISQPTLNAPTISLTGSTLTIANPASNGNFVTKFKVFSNGTALTEVVITSSSTNVDLSTLLTTGGTYAITAKASAANFNDSAASNSESYEAKTQTTPAISPAGGTTIQIDTIDDNATTIEVYADGTKIGEVAKQGGATKQKIDVSTLSGWESLASGNHSITIKTKASGYLDSTSSNAVTVSKAASGGYTVTVNASWFYNTGNLVRINGVEQELDGQKTYTFNNVNTFNVYSSTAMSNITSGTGSIPATYDWSSGWAWSTDIAITQDSSCVVSNDN